MKSLLFIILFPATLYGQFPEYADTCSNRSLMIYSGRACDTCQSLYGYTYLWENDFCAEFSYGGRTFNVEIQPDCPVYSFGKYHLRTFWHDGKNALMPAIEQAGEILILCQPINAPPNTGLMYYPQRELFYHKKEDNRL